MTPQQLDQFFPFVVFFYGFLILLVLEAIPSLVPANVRVKISSHPMFERIQKRQPLAWICFFFGGLWSLQNLWVTF